MKLVPNSRRIALRAYSMWANYLGILALLAPELIYLLAERDTNPRLWWVVGLALIVAGIIGRLIDQGASRDRAPLWAVLAVLGALTHPGQASAMGERPEAPAAAPYSIEGFSAVAVPLIARWEGLRTEAYLDTIARPPVWTVCFGETRGVREGDSYTRAECLAMLEREVLHFRRGLHVYFTPTTRAGRLTASRDAAYVSLAYNAGIRAIGRSTATRRLNEGNIRGGCVALGWWNKAGGRVVRGLVNRRADETRLCLMGLT